MMAPMPTAAQSARAQALRIAKWLVEKARPDEAVAILAAYAACGPNDTDGQSLLAEALRIDPSAKIARMAFERMEGVAGDHALLDQAIEHFSGEELAKLERELRPQTFRRAQVGFNNNLKYKNQHYHVQTEDSGLDKPHIVSHLFADGGRIIKSYKRSYAAEVNREDIVPYVRGLMKGQQMEMIIALRDGLFDGIIEGRESGGMQVLEHPPDVDIKRLPHKKKEEPGAAAVPVAAAPPPPARVPTPAVAAPVSAPVWGRLHVMRSLSGGPELYELRAEEEILGAAGTVTLEGERFCHPREALLRWKDQRLTLEDFDGGNGVFLRIRSRVELGIGDEFVIGDQLLRIQRNPVADDGPDPTPTYFWSSPKGPSSFRVVQIFEGGGEGACVVARGTTVQIGSAFGDMVLARDPLVSDAHCWVEEQAGSIILTDLDSRTGVFVRVQGEQAIAHGDELLVGRTRLLVDLAPK